ncbi:MAG: PstS family phosphate ABC transporter substrate-binding protein [Sphingobacteriales bacterium]|nr:MAG: PstS family phosphate ABC transporter substrate-binding protein [Sphingobacteriales bacterium]
MKKAIYFLLAAGISLSACKNGNNQNNGLKEKSQADADPGTIQIDGSSTVYPITEAVAEEYRVEHKDIKVTVGVSGTGGGFKKFTRGDIDVNDASRPITQSEQEIATQNKIDFIELPIAYDGLAIVVNPSNTWAKDITVEELKKLWEPEAQNKIKTWNQVRAEWPKEEIHLFGAGVESGTYDYFTEAVVGKAHSSRGDYTASEDDNVLVQGISTDKNALGFFGVAYYNENKDKLKIVPVDDKNDANGKGAITPTDETVQNGTYQPLSRPIFIYVNAKATDRQEVKDFVNYYLENAGELAKEVGYVALPQDVYELAKKRYNDKKTGSLFLNSPHVNVHLKTLLESAK